MRLLTFGKVQLVGCAFSRPKPLLLLAYLTLEGPQERRRLTELFWPDADAVTGERALPKKLGQLSVVLAQFKKEGAGGVFPDHAGLDPLPSLVSCDALEFLAALERGERARAVALYQGPFLHDLSRVLGKLGVSGELCDWVLETREGLAQRAQGALLELAEAALESGQLKEARAAAERAYTLPFAPELEPHTLSRLQHLLFATGSGLVKGSEHTADVSLKQLSGAARSLFLALAVQPAPNLSIVRSALQLPLSEASEAHEALIGAGLVTPEAQVLAGGLARRYLALHPREHLPLLLALARATPAAEAFSLYRRVYALTQGFGGVGDLPRARAAYCKRAKSLSDALEFAEAASLLAELHGVERVLGADPDPESRFLAAYALERMGHYKEALGLLEALSAAQLNPDLTALLSVLLWRRGRSEEARAAAETAVRSGLDWLWARATAHTTLGGLAYAGERFLEASSSFKKAGSLFQACGDLNRWVGSLNNHATALDTLAEVEERRGGDAATVEQLRAEAEAGYRTALGALEQTGENRVQRARILLNLGMLWEYRKDWDQAERYYQEALPLAENVKDLEARLQLNLGNAHFMRHHLPKAREYHRQAASLAAQIGDSFVQGTAAANLAIIDKDPDSMEIALELLEQSGNQEQLGYFQSGYEQILKVRLREALVQNDTKKAQFLLSKLGVLYQKEQRIDGVGKVEDALSMLIHVIDPNQRKTLLLTLLGERGENLTSPPN